jgi:hypothetical protein
MWRRRRRIDERAEGIRIRRKRRRRTEERRKTRV